jgi:hypothetical protein
MKCNFTLYINTENCSLYEFHFEHLSRINKLVNFSNSDKVSLILGAIDDEHVSSAAKAACVTDPNVLVTLLRNKTKVTHTLPQTTASKHVTTGTELLKGQKPHLKSDARLSNRPNRLEPSLIFHSYPCNLVASSDIGVQIAFINLNHVISVTKTVISLISKPPVDRRSPPARSRSATHTKFPMLSQNDHLKSKKYEAMRVPYTCANASR